MAFAKVFDPTVATNGVNKSKNRTACHSGAGCCGHRPRCVPDLSSFRQIPDQRTHIGLGETARYIFGGVSCSVYYQRPRQLQL